MSGILLGFNAPGFGTQWIGLVSFFPLLFTLEQLHKKHTSHSGNAAKCFRGFAGSQGELPP